ncbi:pectinesterase family protein [Neolewinella litorea]|uniref:pectinesterase family protein n=1 Tax=Neolewinella litorea TaxID=2562452 RepID=UPI00387377DB
MGEVVHPDGGNNWGRPEKEETARYAGYDNRGPGASPSQPVSWAHQLTNEQAAAYNARKHLLGGWDPME